MAVIIKCKMCGGDIEQAADKTFGTCEYCGSTMTLPKVDDDQRAALFNRGNHFRRIGEFDKALAVYEQIIRDQDADAEAHWCCALCRFGIEYVEDPVTYEYLPTCHRASFDSFLEDVDYKAALEYSDGITRRQYMKDGAKIAEVQRGILATSQNAEPYDVFICYKESDDNGGRTRDSLLAQDIYYQLTEQGRKVFFSRITLEDVAGTQYEPYIFAALNSAKVMIVVGTKPEYLHAVWVKNEWSRFLAMMKKDRHKLLLPCYRDMDPYDMPEQLGVLQSYDMSKIGFIQDLTRGIAKVLDAEKTPSTVKETVVVQQNAAPAVNIAPLLKRVFIFLEDGEWGRADDFCEQVLNIDPECAQAYLGKLMAELHVQKQADLCNQKKPFDTHNNYKNAFRFGDAKLRETLSGYIQFINDRNENTRLEGIYQNACDKMNAAQNEQAFLAAAQEFDTIRSYKDAASLAKRCVESAEASKKDLLYVAAKNMMAGSHVPNYQDAIKRFEALGDWRDSAEQIAACHRKIKEIEAAKERERLEKLYQEATGQLERANSEEKYKAVAKLFAAIKDYKDSADLTEQCLERAEAFRKDAVYNAAKNLMTGNKISNYQEAIKRFETIVDWRDSAAQIALCQQKIKEIEARIEMQRLEHARQEALKERQRLEKLYREAVKELERANNEEKYKAVAKLFAAVGGYKDSAQLAQQCLANAEESRKNAIYASAKKKMAGNRIFNYQEAIKRFEELGDWKDSIELTEICRQKIADLEQQNNNQAQPAHRSRRKKASILTAAATVLLLVAVLGVVVLPTVRYNNAVELMDAEKYEEAIAAFEKMTGYKDSSDKIAECYAAISERDYRNAVALMDAGRYEEAIAAFKVLGDYEDSPSKATEAYMAQLAETIQQVDVGDYITFGAYEQDNDLSNGKEEIEWLVLERQDNKVLVISKYALDCQLYNGKTWGDSQLRNWLRYDFLNNAFSPAEQTLIPTVEVENLCDDAVHPQYTTQDKIFVLSKMDATEYFDSDDARQCMPTAYAIANGASFGNGGCTWWLRNNVTRSGLAYSENGFLSGNRNGSFYVNQNGTVCDGHTEEADTGRYVRPALWINLVVDKDSTDNTDSNVELFEAQYKLALEQMAEGDILAALRSFSKVGDYKDAKEWTAKLRKSYQKLLQQTTISSGADHLIALMADGTVSTYGYHHQEQSAIERWEDIVSVSAYGGCTLGLKADGTVVSSGYPVFAQHVIAGWEDVVSVSAGREIAVGLKRDGTVMLSTRTAGTWTNVISISARGDNRVVALKSDGNVVGTGGVFGTEYDEIISWDSMIAVCVSDEHTFGLKEDGTVVAAGPDAKILYDFSDWTNVVDIRAGSNHVAALKDDGTVIASGDNSNGQCDVSDWTDIVAIAAGETNTVGIKKDGTIVIAGLLKELNWKDIKLPPDVPSLYNTYSTISTGSEYLSVPYGVDICAVAVRENGTVLATGSNRFGQCNVSAWKDIISVETSGFHTVGLKADGTVVAVGYNEFGQCDVSDWENIVSIIAGYNHTVGLKKDGTVVAVGNNKDGQCDVSDWTNIAAIAAGEYYTAGLKTDGTVVATDQVVERDWTDIVAISASVSHLVGLKFDGTVVSTRANCVDSNWTDIVAVSAGKDYTIALKEDGTVVAASAVVGFKDGSHLLNGQLEVSDWTDIVAISAGTYQTMGLKRDGTVVLAADTGYMTMAGPKMYTSSCNVSGWSDIKIP